MEEGTIGMIGIGVVGVAVVAGLVYGDPAQSNQIVTFGTAICGMIAALVRGFGSAKVDG